MKLSKYLITSLACSFLIAGMSSCDENKSYSELLEAENRATNWYLSNFRVEPVIPSDAVFETGPDAPFYRMDADGNVYMRVLNPGNKNLRPVKGDQVYFLFMRTEIKNLYKNKTLTGTSTGNAENMNSNVSGTNLIYGNQILPSTTQYGTGIQVPLDYLGYDCEVDLIIKSVEGMTGDMSECIPYVYNIRYFKAQY